MSNIEQQVVKMEFDNQTFERNVSQSIGSINKLKGSLDLEGAAQGFDNVSEAAGRMNFSPLQNGIETVKMKFSALEVAAVATLTRIVDRAVSAGVSLAKSLTIDPISDGFHEYELKINSVQTMMMSSGESLETVNGYLEQLNLYADKTIYSFSDMTENIGKFTNAGVSLKDAVAAIQGISNEAAISGANANEASRAMYNFAQALSAGSVKLIDWKSIENANMATVEFKEELLKTAVALGTVVEKNGMYQSTTQDANGHVSELFNSTKMFNDSLSSQWMTTEVLTKTLARYSDETTDIGKRAFEAATKVKTFSQLMDTLKEAVGSGWAQSFEIMIGDFEEAKSMFTEISDTIGDIISKQADSRNDMLTTAFASGWKQILNEGIMDAKSYRETVTQVAKDHGVAVDEMIKKSGGFEQSLKEGWLTSDILAEGLEKLNTKFSKMSDEELRATGYSREQVKALNELNEKVKAGKVNLDDFAKAIQGNSGRENLVEIMRNSFQALLSVLKPVQQGITEVFKGLDGKVIYNIIAAIKDFTAGLKLTDHESTNLKNTVKGLASVLDLAWEIFKKGVTIIAPIGKLIRPTLDLILQFTGTIGEALTKVVNMIEGNTIFKNFSQVLKDIANGIVGFIKSIEDGTTNFVKGITEGVKEAVTELNKIMGMAFANNPLNQFGDPALYTAGTHFSKALQLIVKAFQNFKTEMGDLFKDFDLTKYLYQLIQVVSGFSLTKIITNLSKSSKIIKSACDSIQEAFEKLPDIFDTVGDCVEGFSRKMKNTNHIIGAKVLLTYAAAFSILALSLYELGKLDFGKITTGLIGMLGTMGVLVKSIDILSKIAGGMSKEQVLNLKILSGSLTGLANAILVLSTAVKIMGELSWEQLFKGLTGVATLSGTIAISAKALATNSGTVLKGSVAILSFAMAVKVLASAVKPLSEMSWNSLATGLTGIAGLCTEMVIALKYLAKNHTSALKGALTLNVMSYSLLTLIPVMKTFAGMDWSEIGRSMTGLAGSLIVLCTAVNHMNGSKTISGAVSLGIVVMALNGLIIPMKAFASMDLSGIAKAFTVLGGSLAILVSAVNHLGGANTLKGVVSMNLMSVAITTLMIPLEKFSKMDWTGIIKALTMLGGALAELGVALALFNGNIKGATAMLIVASAVDVLAVGLIALSAVDFQAIVKSLVSLALTLATIGISAKLLEGFTLAIVKMSLALTAFGAAASVVGFGMTVLADGISNMADMAVSKIKQFLNTVKEITPILVEVLSGIVRGICEVISNSADAIVQAIYNILHALIQKIVILVPEIVNGILVLIDETMKALVKFAPSLTKSLMEFILIIVNGIADYIGPIAEALGSIFHKIFDDAIAAVMAMDPDELLKLTLSVGIITAFMVAMSALSSLIPGAMVGLLGFTAFIAEFMALLGVIGGIYSIPGLKWFMESGADALQLVGTAIGRFIGGIVGGLAKGATDTLPDVAQNLSDFMINLKPFLDIGKDINTKAFDAIFELTGALTLLTGQKIINSLTSWFTGGVSFTKFGEDLHDFGAAMKSFADSVKDIDPNLVKNAANASQAVSELANGLPKHGGLAQLFTGDTDFNKDFIRNLVPLGRGLKGFGESVKGLDPNLVINSANAAKSISELANGLPRAGGLKGFFNGDMNMVKFATEIEILGKGLKNYSDNIKGMDPNVVINSAKAAQTLSEFANGLPKHGGIKTWFTGDSNIIDFAVGLSAFGPAFKSYADSVKDLDFGVVKASADAAKSISAFAEGLPKHGGLNTLWSGDNDLGRFAADLAKFGPSFKLYAESISGIDPQVVQNTSSAAKSITEFAKEVPNYGGIKMLWEGSNDLPFFGFQLAKFGPFLKQYSDSIQGVDPDLVGKSANAAKVLTEFAKEVPKFGNISSLWDGSVDLKKFGFEIANFGPYLKRFHDTVKDIDTSIVENAGNAAKTISEFVTYIPKDGGWDSLWNGSVDLEKFGDQIARFGPKMKDFADSVAGVDTNVVVNAGNAAKTISEFVTYLPKEGGVAQAFDGRMNLPQFGAQLVDFGPKLKQFADSVKDVDTNVVTNAGNAAKTISEFAKEVPNFGGAMEWWNGDHSLATFGSQIAEFGPYLKQFAENVKDLDPNVVTNAGNAAKTLAEFANNLPPTGGVIQNWTGEGNLIKFSEQLEAFGPSFKRYSENISGMDVSVVENSRNACQVIAEFANSLPSYGGLSQWFSGENDMDRFGTQLELFGQHMYNYAKTGAAMDQEGFNQSITNIDKIMNTTKLVADIGTSSIENIGTCMSKLGMSGVDGFIKAFRDSYDEIKKAGGNVITNVVYGMQDKADLAPKKMKEILKAIKDSFSDYNQKFRDNGTGIVTAIENGINMNGYRLKNAVRDALDDCSTVDLYWTFYGIGKRIDEGMRDGIYGGSWFVRDAAVQVAYDAYEAAKSALQINSPSKLMMKIGSGFDEGFAKGITDNAKLVKNASVDLSDQVIEDFGNAMTAAVKMRDMDNVNPVITPVINLDKVREGYKELDSMANKYKGKSDVLTLDQLPGAISRNFPGEDFSKKALEMASRISNHSNPVANRRSQEIADIAGKFERMFNNSNAGNVSNTFNIQVTESKDPRATADEVSRRIQHQIERKQAVWG